MSTVKTHALGEIISCKLFGISGVPVTEQRKMIGRAIRAAIEYHDKELQEKELEVKRRYGLESDS